MNARIIGSAIVGIGLLVGTLSACGAETSSAGHGNTSPRMSSPVQTVSTPRSSPVSLEPATESEPAGTGEPTAALGVASGGVDQPAITTASQQPVPAVDDRPNDLPGNIGIWTTTDFVPLSGAAFNVLACDDNENVGPVDMSGQSKIDVPVSFGCWVVGLTRTPDGYRLDGPPQRTIYLDAQTNEVNMSYRFLPL